MKITEIVKRLIGSIEPCGDSNIDKQHMDNLKDHAFLTYSLVAQLTQVAKYKDRTEYSMRELGEVAYKEVLELKEMLDEF